MKYLIIALLLCSCGSQSSNQSQPQTTAQLNATNPASPIKRQEFGNPSQAVDYRGGWENVIKPDTSEQYQVCFNEKDQHYHQIINDPGSQQRYLWLTPAPCDCNFFGTITTCAFDLPLTGYPPESKGIKMLHCPANQTGPYIGTCPAGTYGL